MPDIRNLAIWLLLALAVAGWGVGCAERTRAGMLAGQRDAARGEAQALRGAVAAQKAEAAAKLASLTASVRAQQQRIDAAHAAREKADAQNLALVDGLRADLRRLRQQSEAAGRGGGGGGAAGGAAASAGPGAGDGAAGARLLPAPADGAASEEDDAWLADLLNIAYAACRARILAPE